MRVKASHLRSRQQLKHHQFGFCWMFFAFNCHANKIIVKHTHTHIGSVKAQKAPREEISAWTYGEKLLNIIIGHEREFHRFL